MHNGKLGKKTAFSWAALFIFRSSLQVDLDTTLLVSFVTLVVGYIRMEVYNKTAARRSRYDILDGPYCTYLSL